MQTKTREPARRLGEEISTSMTKQYQITLGTGWRRFVHDAPADMQMRGVIVSGAQIGALAMQADGSFVQLNGDWATPLNASRVRHALGQRPPPQAAPWSQVAPARTPPTAPATPVQVTVTVRKRRTIVMPTPGATSQMTSV
jgi:hypothetical protein